MTFRAAITRDHGDPWGKTGMTSAKWLDMPVRTVPIADLVMTQSGVLFANLLGEHAPYGGDPHPHVISYAGWLYLEDGHHRTVRAALRGEHTIEARVLKVPR